MTTQQAKAKVTTPKVTTLPTHHEPVEVPLSLLAAQQLVAKRGNADEDPVFDALTSAAAQITKSAERVRDAVNAILANQMQPAIKNAADARAAAHKIFQNVAPKLDQARRTTEAEIARLEAATAPPAAKTPADAVYYGECRSALLKMPQQERARAVERAIAEGDDTFVGAVLLGNPLLSGIGAAERNALAQAWRRARHAETLDRITRLKGGLEQFDRACGLLSSFALGVLADRNAAIAAAEKSAELARAAMADVA